MQPKFKATSSLYDEKNAKSIIKQYFVKYKKRGDKEMKKILPFLVVRILVLSKFGVEAVINNKTTRNNHPLEAMMHGGTD